MERKRITFVFIQSLTKERLLVCVLLCMDVTQVTTIYTHSRGKLHGP